MDKHRDGNQKDDEREIEQLLKNAGHRENPPADVRARVYAATLDVWSVLPESPRHPQSSTIWRKSGWAAAAATVILAVVVGVVVNDVNPPVIHNAAEIVYARGDYQVEGIFVQELGPVPTKARLRTAPGALLSLRMASGAMVTFNQNTQAQILNADELTLQYGHIYVDVGPSVAEATLVVNTPHAQIVDIGTQFEVELQPAVGGVDLHQVRVAVREGRVDVMSEQANHSAQARDGVGEELVLRGTELLVRSAVRTTATRWDWRKAGRAPYVLTNSSVYDYLRWMAADSGHELQFGSRAVEQMAKIGVLQSKEALTSDETSIEDALAATRFDIVEPREGLWVVQFRSTS